MATTSSLLEGVPGWRVRERQSPLPAPCKCPRNLKSLTARGIKVLVLGAFSVSAFGLYGRRPAPWPTDTQGRPYESADGTAHGYFEWQRCFRAWQAWMDSPVGRREKQAEIDALIEAALPTCTAQDACREAVAQAPEWCPGARR
jgi:hypothetical protein